MDRKIVDYGHVWHPTMPGIASLVYEEIQKGWQPFGTVFLCPVNDKMRLHQAMVMYEGDKVVDLALNGDKIDAPNRLQKNIGRIDEVD